jgi:hypothetical protein
MFLFAEKLNRNFHGEVNFSTDAQASIIAQIQPREIRERSYLSYIGRVVQRNIVSLHVFYGAFYEQTFFICRKFAWQQHRFGIT